MFPVLERPLATQRGLRNSTAGFRVGEGDMEFERTAELPGRNMGNTAGGERNLMLS